MHPSKKESGESFSGSKCKYLSRLYLGMHRYVMRLVGSGLRQCTNAWHCGCDEGKPTVSSSAASKCIQRSTAREKLIDENINILPGK